MFNQSALSNQKEEIKAKPWHSLQIEQVFSELGAKKEGFSRGEVEHRLLEYGPNKIPEKRKFLYLTTFLNQFKNVLIFILIIAALITVFIGHYTDGYVILGAIFINVIFGFFQEAKAEKSLQALKKIVKEEAIVVRENEERKIDASQVVPGDILVLETGNKVLADLRLIEARDLEINESVITGESLPVAKITDAIDIGADIAEQKNMAWMGSTVAKGKGRGIVVATGKNSQFGKITENLGGIEEEKPPIHKKITVLAKTLTIIILAISVFVFLLGLILGRNIIEIFAIAVSLAVAAIPEGLVVAVTVTMAIGMQRVLKQNALIRKLSAAETLGTTTVICSDKTGTITKGEMHVSEIVTAQDDAESKTAVLRAAMMSSTAVVENPNDAFENWRIRGDATESSVIHAAFEAGLHEEYLKRDKKLIKIFSDHHVRKYSAILYKENGENIIYFKGAAEVILPNSKFILKGGKSIHLQSSQRAEFEKIYRNLSQNGFRVMAVCFKGLPEDFDENRLIEDSIFLGFLALTDPIRENVIEAINETKEAGIKTVMITGDNILTAKSIAKKLGLNIDHNKIIEGSQLQKMSDEELLKQIENISVYARIIPQDKHRIVDLLQKKDEIVAMTGDGVNDVLALKKADIGVAVGTATDVAKETADMIILDNNFSSIVSAVKQGRIIFDNIRKITLYLLSDAFSEIIIILGALLGGLGLPLLAPQILWINLITDGFPNMALAFEPADKYIMKEKARERVKRQILNLPRCILIGLISLVTGIANLFLFIYIYNKTSNIDYSRTIIFASLGIDSLLYVFSIRSLRQSIFSINLLSNKLLLIAVSLGFLLQLAGIYIEPIRKILHTVPLGIKDWLIAFALGILIILLVEVFKFFVYLKRKR